MSSPHQTVADLIRDASIFHGTDTSSWKKSLILSDRGICKPILANAVLALRQADCWAGVIRLDSFALRILLSAPPPWERCVSWTPRLWNSNDDIQTANWLQNNGIDVNAAVAAQAVTLVADDNTFHPVKEYLESISWDERPRLDMFVSRYLGGADTPYHSHVGRCSMIAAVARIRQPGCKVDTVPILEGRQGRGKSTALRTLFSPWFSDELADFGSKDAAMQLRGIWGIEISELDAMSRSEVGRTKAFVSRIADRFRPPYGSRVIESPRTCVFWGTTNADDYLKDESGGRRFWPIKTGIIDLNALNVDKDQLWAEAQHRYLCGDSWWIQSAEMGKAAEAVQESRYAPDPWDALIANYIATRPSVTVDEILSKLIKKEADRWEQRDMNRVARFLKARKWTRRQKRVRSKQQYVYVRPTDGGDD